jgi:hypothetical protein
VTSSAAATRLDGNKRLFFKGVHYCGVVARHTA